MMVWPGVSGEPGYFSPSIEKHALVKQYWDDQVFLLLPTSASVFFYRQLSTHVLAEGIVLLGPPPQGSRSLPLSQGQPGLSPSHGSVPIHPFLSPQAQRPPTKQEQLDSAAFSLPPSRCPGNFFPYLPTPPPSSYERDPHTKQSNKGRA